MIQRTLRIRWREVGFFCRKGGRRRAVLKIPCALLISCFLYRGV